ncbi:afadin- and alpha-actinin-binding protein-like isoform X2 [Dermochelys coriacea]|uniref:afadin- and alpha-actinin-binding protein-like isoform X2 n=1 Tax=Dermochelys coriacea TaxID=27794 RepID=UPI0018E80260|nr:afadin- and alpha-actinin-binding protein-like isoform X2 [Dermochelys coriacea]XP_038234809.1 afadin- and alpha-actinin-binding protein-like isoform X2 [Dermochelys coriacea]
MAKYIPEPGISSLVATSLADLNDPLELLEGAGELSGAFCWSTNIDHCISYLNEEVRVLGLAPLYAEGGFDLRALVNGTYALLRLYREASAKLGAMEAEELRRAGELGYLRGRQNKLKVRVEACEREIAAVQSRNKELLALLKGEKDEPWGAQQVVKLLATLASRGAQHRHELRRKEQELSRLKEKMSQQLTDKRDRRAAMEILNNLGRADGRRATWKTGKSLGKKEEEMFRSLLAAQEKQLQELMLENAELKQLLDQLRQDTGGLLGAAQGGEGEPAPEGTRSSNAMQEQLTRGIRDQWCSFKSHVESLGSQAVAAGSQGCEAEGGDPVISVTDHDKEIMKLKAEIEDSQQLIALQQQCFQEQLIAAANSELPANLRGSYFLEEQQRLQEEQQAFRQQKRAFEEERKNFTEAAIRLGHERKQFEEERALLLKQHFLSTMAELGPLATQAAEQEILPQSKKWNKPTYNPYPKANTPVVLVRSRHLAPSPVTPSTAELLRVLKLIPDNRSPPPAQPSQQSNDQKESHKDTACQTEIEDFWPISGDLLDHFLDSSF